MSRHANFIGLTPKEVTTLWVLYSHLLEPYQWFHLLKYARTGYSLRGQRNYHNTLVRKIYRQLTERI